MSENRRRTIGRPKSSWIWEFFNSEIRDGDKWVICKLDKIGTQISQTTTNTNKMHNETHQFELRQFLVDFVLNTSQSLRIVKYASLRQLL
ncbi:uncharacterized protein OCT59_025393 [Rhizophagus irregularis]|uniref:uncharacterized protein n=1 Tax=Rhizophagus irregularis TaxID=588596 RepID=UPI001D95E575|nr:hypothetical protein OCT59_025393 [Rhizophagus irregularis]CAG8755649.1 11273_t:CDS:2 [Rhizophagus irregularis]